MISPASTLAPELNIYCSDREMRNHLPKFGWPAELIIHDVPDILSACAMMFAWASASCPVYVYTHAPLGSPPVCKAGLSMPVWLWNASVHEELESCTRKPAVPQIPTPQRLSCLRTFLSGIPNMESITSVIIHGLLSQKSSTLSLSVLRSAKIRRSASMTSHAPSLLKFQE